MKFKLFVPLALGAALVAGSAMAADMATGDALLKAKGCMMCHNMAGQKVGPGFKETAAKYAGDAGAEATLVAKLKAGNPHPKLTVAASDEELHNAVKAVLAAK